MKYDWLVQGVLIATQAKATGPCVCSLKCLICLLVSISLTISFRLLLLGSWISAVLGSASVGCAAVGRRSFSRSHLLSLSWFCLVGCVRSRWIDLSRLLHRRVLILRDLAINILSLV